MLPAALFKDARYFQISFQGIFLFYGITYLQWDQHIALYCIYLFSCLVTMVVCEWLLGNRKFPFALRAGNSFPSVLITTLGLCLLLKTNNHAVAVLAGIVAIASKYLLRIKGKHIFNPSALGIVVMVFGFGEAWLSPGQWGNGAIILFTACTFGCIVVTRIQKLDVSLFFLLGFAGLMFVRQCVYLGWPLDYFLQTISTGSLLLFTFFMITDPKTMPNNKMVRRLWALAIGVISFYVASFHFMATAPIVVMIIAQLFVPLLDHLFAGNKFDWLKQNAGNITGHEQAQLPTAI